MLAYPKIHPSFAMAEAALVGLIVYNFNDFFL